MAGGVATVGLVVAVSAAGGLGSLGAAYLTPSAIVEQAAAVRAQTNRPFSINLFSPRTDPPPRTSPTDVGRILSRYREELGLADPVAAPNPLQVFEDQLAAVLEARPALVSFHFGLPIPAQLDDLHGAGILVASSATTPEEAEALAASGVDVVFAQGSEAGGHRGTFGHGTKAGLIGTMALVPMVVDALAGPTRPVPVVAAGGIMDGRGIAAALSLGAAGVQLGTAFVPTRESGATAEHKAAILSSVSAPSANRLTRAFTGRPARAVVNRMLDDLAPFDRDLAPYPDQLALTLDIRRAAAARGEAGLQPLWAGQGAAMAARREEHLGAADLVTALMAETTAVLLRTARLAT